jgi:hypothetical protein
LSEAPDYTISRRARRLWTKFCEWYGTAEMSKQFGLVPPQDWCQVIDDIPDRDAMARVLSAVRTKHPKFPPKYPEFDAIVSDCAKPKPISTGPSVPERLKEWVITNKPLSRAQLRMPWTYIGKYFDAPGPDRKMTQNYGIEVTGVIVPADGEHPGYRVMLEDLQMAEAA